MVDELRFCSLHGDLLVSLVQTVSLSTSVGHHQHAETQSSVNEWDMNIDDGQTPTDINTDTAAYSMGTGVDLSPRLRGHTVANSPFPFPLPSLPLEVGPWNPAKGSGRALYANPAQLKSNLVHFSLKIWHLVATIFMIFLRIDWPNFVQFTLVYTVKVNLIYC